MVKSFFLACFVCICTSSFGQVTFFSIYSNNGLDRGQDIIQLNDGTYVLTGTTTSFFNAESQMLLMRLNADGSVLWSKDFGGTELELGKRVVLIDSSLYFIGETTNNATGDFNFLIVKANLNGTIDTSFQIGTTGWDFVSDALLLPDSTIIISGRTENTIDGIEDAYAIRIDTLGNVLSTFQSDANGVDRITSTALFADSIVYMGGYRESEDSNFQLAYITAFDLSGNVIWDKEYGTQTNFKFNYIAATVDGLYGIGSYQSTTDLLWKEYFIRLNYDGSIIETNQGFDIGSKSAVGLVNIAVNKYFMAFEFDNQYSYPGGTDVNYLQFSESLDFQGTGVELKSTNPDYHGNMKSTLDGGIIAIGTSTDFGMGDEAVYVIKTGPNNAYPNMIAPGNYAIVGLTEVQKQTNIGSMYPNPTTNELSFNLMNKESTLFSVQDQYGKEVLPASKITTNASIDVSHLASGMYFGTLQSGDQFQVIRFVKK